MNIRTAFFSALLLPASAATQATSPGDSAASGVANPANVAKAQADVDLSGTLFKAKDFAGALDALRKAEPLLAGDPSLGVALFNIARCLEELRCPVEAAAYDLYISQPVEAGRPGAGGLRGSQPLRAPATELHISGGATLGCPAGNSPGRRPIRGAMHGAKPHGRQRDRSGRETDRPIRRALSTGCRAASSADLLAAGAMRRTAANGGREPQLILVHLVGLGGR